MGQIPPNGPVKIAGTDGNNVLFSGIIKRDGIERSILSADILYPWNSSTIQRTGNEFIVAGRLSEITLILICLPCDGIFWNYAIIRTNVSGQRTQVRLYFPDKRGMSNRVDAIHRCYPEILCHVLRHTRRNEQDFIVGSAGASLQICSFVHDTEVGMSGPAGLFKEFFLYGIEKIGVERSSGRIEQGLICEIRWVPGARILLPAYVTVVPWHSHPSCVEWTANPKCGSPRDYCYGAHGGLQATDVCSHRIFLWVKPAGRSPSWYLRMGSMVTL